MTTFTIVHYFLIFWGILSMTASVFRGLWWEGHRDLKEWVILTLPCLIPIVFSVVLNHNQQIQENFWIRQLQNILVLGLILLSLVLPLETLIELDQNWESDDQNVSFTMVIAIILPFWSQAAAFVLSVVVYGSFFRFLRVIGSMIIIIILIQHYDGIMLVQMQLVVMLTSSVWWSMKRLWKQWGEDTLFNGMCVHFIGSILAVSFLFVSLITVSMTVDFFISSKKRFGYKTMILGFIMQLIFICIISSGFLTRIFLVHPLHAYNPFGKRKIGWILHALYCLLIIISLVTNDLVLMSPVLFELCIRIGLIIEFLMKRENHIRGGDPDYISRMYVVRFFQTIWICMVCCGEDVGSCFSGREQQRPNQVPLLLIDVRVDDAGIRL